MEKVQLERVRVENHTSHGRAGDPVMSYSGLGKGYFPVLSNYDNSRNERGFWCCATEKYVFRILNVAHRTPGVRQTPGTAGKQILPVHFLYLSIVLLKYPMREFTTMGPTSSYPLLSLLSNSGAIASVRSLSSVAMASTVLERSATPKTAVATTRRLELRLSIVSRTGSVRSRTGPVRARLVYQPNLLLIGLAIYRQRHRTCRSCLG